MAGKSDFYQQWGRLVCALVFLAFCSQGAQPGQGQCGDGWEERPGTDTCYSFVDSLKNDRVSAISTCSGLGGFLVSINSKDEETYLKSRLDSMATSPFWIGVDHIHMSGFYWTDDSPFTYLNWAAGEGLHDDKYYAVLFKEDMLWWSELEESKAGVICEKHLDNKTPPMVKPPEPQQGTFYGCDQNWIGFQNSCYFFSRERKTWLEAQATCKKRGADLASIQSEVENNLVWSFSPDACLDIVDDCEDKKRNGECESNGFEMSNVCPATCGFCDGTCRDIYRTHECDYWASIGECPINPEYMWEKCRLSCGCDITVQEGYWVGLNDKLSPLQYEWSDGSDAFITKWSHWQPDNYHGKLEDCVLMHGTTGLWSDVRCDKESMGFVCEKPKTFQDDEIDDPLLEGCPDGSLGHQDKCYRIVTEKKSWSQAKQNCKTRKESLAIFNNAASNAFVSSQIFASLGKEHAWIGLKHNGLNHLEWVDGSTPVALGKFDSTATQGYECIAESMKKLWSSIQCDEKLSYVCESRRYGAQTEVPATLQTPSPCPGDWTDFGDKCFKLFSEPKNWDDASKDCETYGGSLMSIHDDETNSKLDQFGSAMEGVWIGLRYIYDDKTYEWTDGTLYDYHPWATYEPEPIGFRQYRKFCTQFDGEGVVTWSTNSCRDKLSYACQVFQGGLFIPRSTAFVYPVKFCEDDQWREFDGGCYLVHTSELVEWRLAREECIKKGADLVSIHSTRENIFLQGLTDDDQYSHNQYWIGFHEIHLNTLQWSDQSAIDHWNFGDNEPNNNYGSEKCVSMYSHDGKWYEDHCSTKAGYICKKLEGSSLPPELPTKVEGKCLAGFKSEASSKTCFYFSGNEEAETWEEAQKACHTKGTNAGLATITGTIDQAFATLLIEESKNDVWIGFNSKGHRKEWRWVDNSVTDHTYWGEQFEQDMWRRKADENCVVLQRNAENDRGIGYWAHKPCSNPKPYLCQAQRDNSNDQDPDPFEDQYNTAKCKNAGEFLYHNRCYTFHDDKKSYEEAKGFCGERKNWHLALVWDNFEGARMTYEAFKHGMDESFWIDIHYHESLSYYVWGEDYEVQDTPWFYTEPDQPEKDSCVTYLNGYWYDESCSMPRTFFCVEGRYEDFIPRKPLVTQVKEGECSDPKHIWYKRKCYWIPEIDTGIWAEANRQCNKQGMSLASVHTKGEVDFIYQTVGEVRKDEIDAWIGLEKGFGDTFYWSDDSAYSYTFWDLNEPSSLREPTENDECVKIMMNKYGRWNDFPCDTKLAYVCSKEAGEDAGARDTAEEDGKGDEEDKTATGDKGGQGDEAGAGSKVDSGTNTDAGQKESNGKYKANSGSMSPAGIAGICFVVLAVCVGLLLLVVVLLRSRQRESFIPGENDSSTELSFENAFFDAERSEVELKHE